MRHSVVPLLAYDWTRDRSHLRSSIASAVQFPLQKFPFLRPRGAPGLSPPCSRHRVRPRRAGRWHGVPARVSAPQRGACLKFASRISTSWSMGLSAFFYRPRPGASCRAARIVESWFGLMRRRRRTSRLKARREVRVRVDTPPVRPHRAECRAEAWPDVVH